MGRRGRAGRPDAGAHRRRGQRTPHAGDELPERLGFEVAEDGGVLVFRDGRPQSHVDPADPARLEFPYVAHLAMVLDLVPGSPAPERLGVTHVGGAGLTLARWVQHARPGSPQIVLEPDAALTEAVRARLPLPTGHRIRVRPQDGASGMAALRDDSADAVVVDAFDEGEVPAELLTPAFAADCMRVLGPGGVLAMNLSDSPGLPTTRATAAAWREGGWSGTLATVATREVARGKQPGNVVLVAQRGAGPAPSWLGALRQRATSAAFPTEMGTA
ncbi:spermidine synthase [Kytococcus sp. Marseille-QA3725]